MDQDMYKKAMYSGFFDELGQLEKQAMLEKQAVSIGTIGKGFKKLWKDPKKAWESAKHTFRVGADRAARGGPGAQGPIAPAKSVGDHLRRAWGGASNVARTPVGQAALVGGGGLAAVGGGAAIGASGGNSR